jgi:hypothetical protein
MPAVVGQDPAAGDGRIQAPVDAGRIAGRRRAHTQSLPGYPSHRADGVVPDELGRPPHDRRVVPVVDRVQDPAALGGQPADHVELGGERTSGFSQSTCRPRVSARSISGAWLEGGVQMSTKSSPGCSSSASAESNQWAPASGPARRPAARAARR